MEECGRGSEAGEANTAAAAEMAARRGPFGTRQKENDKPTHEKHDALTHPPPADATDQRRDCAVAVTCPATAPQTEWYSPWVQEAGGGATTQCRDTAAEAAREVRISEVSISTGERQKRTTKRGPGSKTWRLLRIVERPSAWESGTRSDQRAGCTRQVALSKHYLDAAGGW
jgi:hypothetical protein